MIPTEVFEIAKYLAETINGGTWEIDYTETQQQVWIKRAWTVYKLAHNAKD